MKCPDYIWIAIPVYNHADTVKDVVEKTLLYCTNVVVVDDGSTDAKIAELLYDINVEVITHKINMGKGAALRTAAEYIIKKAGRYIITLDADGQHAPEDIENFLPHLSGNCKSIIIGTRNFNSGNIPEKSKFGRKFSNFWIYLETGCDIEDSQSGFRGYPVRLFTDIKCVTEHYAFETEILVRGIWEGINVINVNISVYYPEHNKRITHFKPFLDNLRISLLHTRLTVEKVLNHLKVFQRK